MFDYVTEAELTGAPGYDRLRLNAENNKAQDNTGSGRGKNEKDRQCKHLADGRKDHNLDLTHF